MKIKIPGAVSRTAHRAILKTQKNSPTLMFGAGLVGFGATVYLSSRATLRVEAVIDETNTRLATVENHSESEEQRTKAKAYVYGVASRDLLKLYAPAIVTGTATVFLLTKSHTTLLRRNAALGAAYAAVAETLDRYRTRVRDELGIEKDLEFLHGKHEETVLFQDKNGPKKKKVTKAGDDNSGLYSYIFDDLNRNWSEIHDYNVVFLRGVQNHANDKLRAKGHIFLNEVLDMLGMARTESGALVGWRYEGGGAGFVDFGIFTDRHNDQIHEFLVGTGGQVWLDFNVDGEIHKLIGKKGGS